MIKTNKKETKETTEVREDGRRIHVHEGSL